MRINTAKQRMLEGKAALGVELGFGSPQAAQVLSGAGFDFVWVDNQHGCWNYDTSMAAFKSICLGQAIPMARVRQNNDYYAIGGLLDRGALGIVVPMVETVEHAKAAAHAMRYPPQGARSLGPFEAQLLYGEDYVKCANEQVFLAVQIESKKAVENAEGIMAVDGVDGCFVGPGDLAKTMGVDFGCDEHEKAILKVLEVCRKTHKIPGIWAGGGSAKRRLEQGFLYLMVGGDNEFVTTRAQEVLRKLRQ